MSLSELIRGMKGGACQEPNWDSYGADPVTDRTIDVAAQIADWLDGLVIDGRKLNRADATKDGDIAISDGDESVWIQITVDFAD